jgi:multiple sugar transport system substrate-binding protein
MNRKLTVLLLAVFTLSLSMTFVSKAADDITLRWRTRPDNQAEIDLYQSISDTIDKEWDGVTLKYEPGGTEGAGYQATLLTEVAAGQAPDVFWIPGSDVATFAKAGAILNLNDLAKDAKFDVSVFYPQQVKELTYNPDTKNNEGALWGLPRDASSMVLYYNADLFEEAGVDTPDKQIAAGKWDWKAFEDTAKAISQLSSGSNQIYGFGMNSWWANWLLFVNEANGNKFNSYFNEDRSACGLNQPGTTDAMKFMASLYANKYAVPFGTDSEPPFVSGNVGMFMNGRWATPNNLKSLKFKWNAAEVPAAPDGTKSNWLFWGAYVVNAKTQHPKEAFELLTRLTSVEIQSQVTALGANIPSRAGEDAVKAFTDSLKDQKADLNNQAWVDGLQYAIAEAPLWGANFQNIDSVVGAEVGKVMSGDVKPEDFTKNICDQVNTFFKSGS